MKRIDAISAFGGIARYSETQQNIIGIRTGAGELARPEESESFLFKNVGPGSNDFAIPKERINVALSFPNLGNKRG